MTERLFSSESVSEGHPDKMADQISDAILDDILRSDPYAKVACETLVKTGMVLVAGEISTHAWSDIEQVVRRVLTDIGYNDESLGFSASSCAVISSIGKQSEDIARGVDTSNYNHGAGDQGMMFGFACHETEELMPLPITYAHKLMKKQSEVRKSGALPWLRPDAKSQVTVRYSDDIPVSIESIVLSTQHSPDISEKDLREAVIEEIILPVIPKALLSPNVKFLINPTGRFVTGGPVADCGLTGRKIIVDTYGGMARHGGGAFSGKDATKVDRSGAYIARYIAKNIVAAKMAQKCEVQISYAIGVPDPISLYVNCFGTNVMPEERILQIIYDNIDLRPHAIINMLSLRNPIFQKTAVYGHFGRTDVNCSWEKLEPERFANSM